MGRSSNHKTNSIKSIRGKNLFKSKIIEFKRSENLHPFNKANLVTLRNYRIAPQVEFEIVNSNRAPKTQTCHLKNSSCEYKDRFVKEHLLSKNRMKSEIDNGLSYFYACNNR